MIAFVSRCIAMRLMWIAALAAMTVIRVGVAAFAGELSETTLRVQGSTTFNAEILEPNRSRIEQRAGRPIDVIANKSSWGLLALIEKRVDLAMISAPLDAEVTAARKLKPEVDFSFLQEFRIKTTRIAFAVNAANPVKTLSFDTVARILNGEITNWKDAGGEDLAVLVVAVKEGGGTVVAVRAQMLGEAPLAPGAVRLESAKHVVQVVSQERGAIGITQLGLVREAGLHEVATERAVEQPLSYVTAGAPGLDAQRLIEATRTIAARDHD